MARGWMQIGRAIMSMGGEALWRQKVAASGFADSAIRDRRVSKYGPHQNTRQRARYARQVAAGKLNMEISP